jgi:DNA-directed RNA polymerase subunit F
MMQKQIAMPNVRILERHTVPVQNQNQLMKKYRYRASNVTYPIKKALQ